MNNELTAKLERLKNRRTAYELAAIRGDERVLLAYSCGRGRRDILNSCRKRAEAVVRLLGNAEITFGRTVADGATAGEWSIRFTGRTQRDAYVEGELPYVGDLK
jgi:hypothetical protein